MGDLPWSDMGSAVCVLTLLAALHKTAFVIPPPHIAPIWLIVFFEVDVEFKIFSDTHQDRFFFDPWVFIVLCHVPLATSKVESSYS